MAYNKRDNQSGGRSYRGGGGYKGKSRDGERSQMHKATCADCGKSCEVPFKPTGSKPIFCSTCFERNGGGSRNSATRDSNSRHSDRRSERRHGGDRRMFKAVCEKCGNTCEVPFKPASGKNVYCSPCFGKGGGSDNNSSETNKQFEIVNAKLDKILKALGSSQSVKKEDAVEVVKEVKKAKKAIKPKPKSKAKKVAKLKKKK